MGRRSQEELAQHYGLSRNQEAILTSLRDGRLYTFQDIIKATGLYSNLPAELRQRHLNSLGSKGYVRESEMRIDGRAGKPVQLFQISSTGCKLLGQPIPPLVKNEDKARAEFLERFHLWEKADKELRKPGESAAAQKAGLVGNTYLILKALEDGDEKTFKDIVQTTGVYSSLTQYLRARHPGSLGSLGYVAETHTYDNSDDGEGLRSVFAFRITRKGKNLLAALAATR